MTYEEVARRSFTQPKGLQQKSRTERHPVDRALHVMHEPAPQYSLASMMVMTRLVTLGSVGSGEWHERPLS